jgi:NAD(P)-dependent dehydrogenase (short-subunit alcohol dehydrogenase family)
MKIVITGTSSGIGRALAQRYCEAGHQVWGIARRDQADFAAERSRLQQAFCFSRVDITKWEELSACSRQIAAQWGGVDALICGAGMQGPLGPAMGFSPQAWVESLNTNLNGTFQTLLAMHDLLKKAERRAKVVCFSGGGSTGPRPFFTPYAVAKAGVVRMVENLAHEWATLPIDINAIAPGAVNTRMTDEVIAAGPQLVGETEYRKTLEQKQKGGTPLHKVGEALDFLIAPESDGISGRLISGLWDPYHSFPDWREAIQSSDVYTLRRVVPQDRGLGWK